jgi:hypothetical protein
MLTANMGGKMPPEKERAAETLARRKLVVAADYTASIPSPTASSRGPEKKQGPVKIPGPSRQTGEALRAQSKML